MTSKVNATTFDPNIIPLALDTVGDGVWEVDLTTNAFGLEEIRLKAQEVGIAGFLVKPVSRSTLFDSIMTGTGTPGERPTPGPTSTTVAAALKGEPVAPLQGARVLLVEDNDVNQLVARGMLESWGVRVDTAADGRIAVSMIGAPAEPYDAVLMDLQMPNMDGYEATRRIRANPSYAHVPIIAMTADAFEAERQACLEAGMDDHVAKPVDANHLLRVLARWIRGRRAAAPPAPPPFALETILLRLNGNRSLVRRLLQIFVRDFASASADIRAAVARGDVANARFRVHTIKGVAANLSAAPLHAAAERLEAAWNDDDLTRAGELLELFETALADALVEARTLEV